MASEDINHSPVEDNHSTDLDRKEDIVYQARSVPTNELDEKSGAASRDESSSIDSESAGEQRNRMENKRKHANASMPIKV